MSTVTQSRNRSVPGPPNQTPRSTPLTGRGKEMAVVETDTKLPQLKNSDNAIDKTKPLPTSLQSDFLPDDILFALTQPPPQYEKLGPPSRYRNVNTTTATGRAPPANLFNHPKRRDRFKHLTENVPCVCGAGKDLSFLYDVPKKQEPKSKKDQYDKSHMRLEEFEEEDEGPKEMTLPDTLLPDEYHIVKNKGVLGLEYHEDNFATHPLDHEKHLVMFPSMKPAGRYEVIKLRQAMDEMLQRAGVNDDETVMKGPTQMHNLLELIKKEQDIYNVIFHELIRQVSIECLDRGSLLATLRDRYKFLLSKVPRQIRGLHEEVLAQRALDRRLTEELMRFKSTISVLTGELSTVKEHDEKVTEEANQAQDDLKNALAESQKNASLLAEYHDLYELQRKRLEKQVGMLSEEKEIWGTAAYSLALKVTEEHSLNTARRLHVTEKAWSKLANHFTILLSDKDTEMLTKLQSYVDQWREIVDEFNRTIKEREQHMVGQLKVAKGGIQNWKNYFTKYFMSKEGHLKKTPDMNKCKDLYNDIKNWEMLLSGENEKFGGDVLLSGQETLLQIKSLVEAWTDTAIKIFTRHRGDQKQNHPDHEDMLVMNGQVDKLLSQFTVRLTGENGVATGIIHVSNNLENWDTKLNAVLSHGSSPISENDWLRFYQLLDEWIQTLDDTNIVIGATQKEEDRNEGRPHYHVDPQDMMRATQKWLSSSTNSIDSEDAKLVEAVATLHKEMVKWMVQILLRLAPDREDHSDEAKEAVLLGSTSVGQLQSNAKSLFDRLEQFSAYVSQCCSGIVHEEMQIKLNRHQEDADHEYKDLLKLKTLPTTLEPNLLKSECEDWIKTAKLLLQELRGEVEIDRTPAEVEEERKKKVSDVSEPDTKQLSTDQVAYHDKEKLETEESQVEEPAEGAEGDEGEQEPTEEQAETEAEKTGEEDIQGAPQTPKSAPQTPKAEPQTPKAEPQTPNAAEEPAPTLEETVAPEETKDEPPKGPALEMIGYDDNTRVATLEDKAKEAKVKETLSTEPRPHTPNTKKAFEALAAVETLQDQLISTEERAQTAEEKVTSLEESLKEALEKIRKLERTVAGEDEANKVLEPPKPATSEPPKADDKSSAAASDKKSDKGDKKPSSRGSSREGSKKSKKKN